MTVPRLMALLLTLLTALLLGGCGGAEPSGAEPSAAEAEPEGQLWTCGMHPQVVQDSPDGGCPLCGMDLTPMGASSAGDDDAVHIHPGTIQQMGVETLPVERTTVFRHLRTIGEVEVGEDELSVVNLRFSGWVEKIHVDRTGDKVRRGQALFEVYSPELVSAQEDYLLALRAQGKQAALTNAARRKFELWGIADRDIEAVAQAGEASRTLPVRAPRGGFVLHKNIVQGARVNAGQDLYRIGDLQRIWVTAEVYEHDAPWVQVGQPAELELTHMPGERLEGEVAYVYPTLNKKSRTLSIRLEFNNPGVTLKPGMFATVHVQHQRRDEVVAVPSEAILHSGRRQLVFVAQGEGRFEPREIATGLVGDRRMTEVTSGLEPGELVVVSGQFLLDSESQLQEALRKLMASAKGKTFADQDPEHDHPEQLYSCPMHPKVTSEEPGRCPDCGMDLVQRDATPEELAAMHPVAQPGQWTCPMHPEIISDEDSRCPICKMFLQQVPEPKVALPGQWTCPMHPEVIEDEDGRCPTCNMFLQQVPEAAP